MNHSEHPVEAYEGLANAGLTGMVVPEEYDGPGCTYLQLSLVMETLGQYSPAIAEYANLIMFFAVTSPRDAAKKEITAFILERDENTKGYTVSKPEQTMGMHGADANDASSMTSASPPPTCWASPETASRRPCAASTPAAPLFPPRPSVWPREPST